MKLINPMEIIDFGDAFLSEEGGEELWWPWPWPVPQDGCLYTSLDSS